MVKGLLLAALFAVAPTGDEPHPEAPPPPAPRRSFLLPAFEVGLVNFSIAGFNNLVTRESWALTSVDLIASHFVPKSWTFDSDYFITNQFLHPYQGALSMTAARSAGLSFYWAALYPVLASLAWELAFEAEPPSVNDQFTTSLGGVFLGEVLHRAALLTLVLGDGPPRLLRRLLAALIDPMGALNGALFEGRFDANDLGPTPRFATELRAGVNGGLRRTATGYVGLTLVYGVPGETDVGPVVPFSHFVLSADLTLGPPIETAGNLFVRGVLVGRQYQAGNVHGVWGAFGMYDYAAPRPARASSTGVGFGTTFRWALSTNAMLVGTAIGGAMPFAAVGAADPAENNGRNYHIGPGTQGIVEFALVHATSALRFGARHWLCTGLYVAPVGVDAVGIYSLRFDFMLWQHLALGIEAVLSTRDARFVQQLYNAQERTLSGRLTLSWWLGGDFRPRG